MVMAFGSTSRAYPILAARECLVTKLLAVVALYQGGSPLKDAGIRRLTSCEVVFLQESPGIAVVGEVYHHGSICLRVVLSAQPGHLGDVNFILLAQGVHRSRKDLAFLVENGSTIDIIHFDWVQLVSGHSCTRSLLGFNNGFDPLQFFLVPTPSGGGCFVRLWLLQHIANWAGR
jgi:hypothetical protein